MLKWKYNVLTVASYILRYSKAKRFFINYKKLKFLLILLQGKFLVENNVKLFEEKIMFLGHISFDIKEPYEKMCLMGGLVWIINDSDSFLDKSTKEVIEFLVQKYSKERSAWRLEQNIFKTILEKERKKDKNWGVFDKELSDDLIKEYFLTDEGQELIS